MMAFMGVRSSWLMLARNWLLAWLAALGGLHEQLELVVALLELGVGAGEILAGEAEAAGHVVEGAGEVGELVVAGEFDVGFEVARAQRIGAGFEGAEAAGEVAGDDEGEAGGEQAGEQEDGDGDLAGEAGGVVEVGAGFGDEVALVLLQLGEHLLHDLLAERLGMHDDFGDGFGLVAAEVLVEDAPGGAELVEGGGEGIDFGGFGLGVWERTCVDLAGDESRRELNWAMSSGEAPPPEPASAVIWLRSVTCFWKSLRSCWTLEIRIWREMALRISSKVDLRLMSLQK